MTKICFFIYSISSGGGTERVCASIANKLAEMRFDVTILSMHGYVPFFQLHKSIRIVPVYKKKVNFKLRLPITVMRIRSEIRRIAPHVIVNVDSALFAYSFVSVIGLNIRNIVWEHFNFNVSLNTTVRGLSRKLAAKYSSAIVTLTEKDKLNWQNSLQCKAPIFVINNPSPFSVQKQRVEGRKPVVLSVGRLTAQKGFDRLLETWQIVQKSGICGWELHIVGSGELNDILTNKIRSEGIEAVKLIPHTSSISDHYKRASIYCMTSRFEGFPMVLLEAQSCGLPLISFDCDTGPAEIIDGENGVLVKDGDKEALAQVLIGLINNEARRQVMGDKSLENSAKYSIDEIMPKWISLLGLNGIRGH